jgi:hypothetical protein
MDTGPRTHVDDMIRRPNGLFIVFDHDHGIAQIPQARQGVEQPPVVALMQTDRGLIQDIQDPDQTCADLAREPDPLGLTTR